MNYYNCIRTLLDFVAVTFCSNYRFEYLIRAKNDSFCCNAFYIGMWKKKSYYPALPIAVQKCKILSFQQKTYIYIHLWYSLAVYRVGLTGFDLSQKLFSRRASRAMYPTSHAYSKETICLSPTVTENPCSHGTHCVNSYDSQPFSRVGDRAVVRSETRATRDARRRDRHDRVRPCHPSSLDTPTASRARKAVLAIRNVRSTRARHVRLGLHADRWLSKPNARVTDGIGSCTTRNHGACRSNRWISHRRGRNPPRDFASRHQLCFFRRHRETIGFRV